MFPDVHAQGSLIPPRSCKIAWGHPLPFTSKVLPRTDGLRGVGPLLEFSEVIMFAKSNLNGVTCEYSGGDSCTASSNECCSRNDAVYKYLLAKTPPSTIQWNFDKIILDTDGLPFSGETIMHGGDIDRAVSRVVDGLLQKAYFESVEVPASIASLAPAAMAALLAAVVVAGVTLHFKRPDAATDYYLQIK
ncbi:unnamed protein product [Effrenium voratum]|nr:unnamed protein product [Effrenium voratum]